MYFQLYLNNENQDFYENRIFCSKHPFFKLKNVKKRVRVRTLTRTRIEIEIESFG